VTVRADRRPGVAVAALTLAVVALGSACRGDDGTAVVGGDTDLGRPSGDAAASRPLVDGADPGSGRAPEPIRPVVEIPAEWPSEIEAVYGRYWLYWEAFAAAHGPPTADPTYRPLRELSTPANWSSLEVQLRSFADDGLVLELPDGSISEHLIRLPGAAVLTGAEGEEVVLQDCWIDDFVQRTVDGAVVDQAREARLMNVVMRVVEGEWRVDGVTRATEESDGIEQCAQLIG
jgi:hypothetical protein